MKTSKKITLAIASIVGIVVVAGAVYWFSMPSEQRNMVLFMMVNGDDYENHQEYQVIERNSEAIRPTGFEPFEAVSNEEDNNINIATVTEMVQNENSKMLKKGMVQALGIDDHTGWYLLADEGAAEGENPYGPSPLSYYTAGLAANLHTQILKAAEVKDIELDSVKVEILNIFRWDEMMSIDGAGFLDLTTTNIIIESSASEEVVQEIIEMALNSWAAGEALRNETVIEPSLVVNGENWENYRATPGTANSDESFDDGFKISSVTDVPKTPEYLELTEAEAEGEDLVVDFDTMSNLQFEIFAIAETAEKNDRPYLSKITLSTPSAETWEIYSDEFMGNNDTPVAPTSLEYFTLGTSLCLTSQTTLASAMMGLDFEDYRVEQQIDYRLEDVGSIEMAGYADTVHSYILIESDESQERLEEFFNRALSLCFAGEGLKNETEMVTNTYLNGEVID